MHHHPAPDFTFSSQWSQLMVPMTHLWGWANGYDYTKDVFTAKNQIEASQYPLQTKGRSDLNQHEVIWHIQMRLWGGCCARGCCGAS